MSAFVRRDTRKLALFSLCHVKIEGEGDCLQASSIALDLGF
jgi:hypothetical protein